MKTKPPLNYDFECALGDVTAKVWLELRRSVEKWPNSDDQMLVLNEEVGELTKALLEQKHEPEKGVTNEDVMKEAIQVAAMAIRLAILGDKNFRSFTPAIILKEWLK